MLSVSLLPQFHGQIRSLDELELCLVPKGNRQLSGQPARPFIHVICAIRYNRKQQSSANS